MKNKSFEDYIAVAKKKLEKLESDDEIRAHMQKTIRWMQRQLSDRM